MDERPYMDSMVAVALVGLAFVGLHIGSGNRGKLVENEALNIVNFNNWITFVNSSLPVRR